MVGGCVYYNAVYNANRDFGRAQEALDRGDRRAWRIGLDSVIVKTGRVLENHPDSKYADDAALLKARSEIQLEKWESAYESAGIAVDATDDSSQVAVGRGLMGIAAYGNGDPVGADTLLSAALAGSLGDRDRSEFHFWRGRARLQLGQGEAAAADLRSAVAQVKANGAARLDLAVALTRVAEYDEAAKLTGMMLQAVRFGVPSPALRAHVDTLIVRAPGVSEGMVRRLLTVPAQPQQRALYHLLLGMALDEEGDPAGAVLAWDSAAATGSATRAGAEGAYYAARERLHDAVEPADIPALIEPMQTAARTGPLEVRSVANRYVAPLQTFTSLMGAYGSRGKNAAEALLRAAEIARDELGSPALARGLYLRYVELVPDSRWVAKAIFGALSLSGYRSAGEAVDEGEATDRKLRTRLAALPPADPYRVALAREPIPPDDSSYVWSERALRVRLEDIRLLYDESARRVAADSGRGVAPRARAPADSAAASKKKLAEPQ